ncbi:glycine cleavage system aminomethyltransferase GcvT [bacterium]|nr:glycine cleavage system aminomethyltransferase GcvT [bacterium]
MPKQTPLYDRHAAKGAKFVDFAGWDMPIAYGSQLDEHHAVREKAGVFDVSHMTAVDIEGAEAVAFMRKLLANDVAKLKKPGKALYTCMLQEDGGIIDDLICYRMRDDWFRVVVNAGTTDKDVAWMQQQVEGFDAAVTARPELCILAVQGPFAREICDPLLGKAAEAAAELKPFTAVAEGPWFVGRTGYTGEDGFEIITDAEHALKLWGGLMDAHVVPIGLGARDTLRLEAGMNLYGQDMDESVSPLACGLEWTVSMADETRDFNGRAALEAQKAAGDAPVFIGVVLEGRGVMRAHQKVLAESGDGELTSGGFSPTMQASIGLARLPPGELGKVTVEIRGREVPARVVTPPFVRNGDVLV